ncbi:unnamed protein product [Brassicogethes aeneus]|uniref:Uncharacterized protein n=1 Tax=Brassicogethes aeneus TaxID=1431903 RepID=A0A9P0FC61_BRAAE|nr:unnamed protein product [Brassicogethes aeneus]
MKSNNLFKKISKHEKSKTVPTSYPKKSSSKSSFSTISLKSKKSGSIIATIKRVISGKKPKGSDTTIKEFNLPSEDKSNSSIAIQSDGGTYEIEMKNDLLDTRSYFNEIPEVTHEISKNKLNESENNTPRAIQPEHSSFATLPIESKKKIENIRFTRSDDNTIIQFRKNHIHEVSEINFKQIQELATQLKEMEIVSKHAQLQCDVDFKTSTVINQIWVQQLEVVRSQERALQDMLNAMVKQNRKLQSENETLFRKHEKSIKKLHAFTEYKSMQDLEDTFKCNCDKELDYVLNHNEKLQQRLDTYSQQLEQYENDLSLSQRKCDGLNKQLRSSNTDIQFLKAKLERSKIDYNLEVVSLNVKLQNSEQVLKETMEVGESLIGDLNNIKKQFKDMPTSINWSKLKVSFKILFKLLHSYTNKIFKYLI